MTTKRAGSFVCIALSSALVWSCGRGPSNEETKPATTANATAGGLEHAQATTPTRTAHIRVNLSQLGNWRHRVGRDAHSHRTVGPM